MQIHHGNTGNKEVKTRQEEWRSNIIPRCLQQIYVIYLLEILQLMKQYYSCGQFPNITEAIEVMKAWGFIYKTAAFVWVKKNKKSDSLFWGMGAYTRANAEVCLLGVSKKTKASKIVISHGVHQIIQAKIGKHSEKPIEVSERIVDLVGDVERIELFARRQVDGWDCFGDEV